jgi:uncharacterized surface protein with fasciclin (FAS1) repeats
VNSVLSMPMNLTDTLQEANLTAVVGAINMAGVGSQVTHMKDLTIFVPNNDAFNKIGNITANMTAQQLGAILNYHVVPGMVDYSTMLGNMTLKTAAGSDVTIQEINGTFFVNSAKIIIQDLLVSNGVVHVLDKYVLWLPPA